MTEDLSLIARDQHLPVDQVARTVQLLDEGNTIPFICRFRKDQTGGLDADRLRAIKKRVAELRALNERKAFILKSIESQGALSEDLARDIQQAPNSRRLEDLYLPFKAKKQSLALTAKQQGLEPLANDLFSGDFTEEQLAARAIEFVRVDRGLTSVHDVMVGVSHLIAERYSERSDLRRELRSMIWQTGQLTSRLVAAAEPPPAAPAATDSLAAAAPAAQQAVEPPEPPGVSTEANTLDEAPVDLPLPSPPIETSSALGMASPPESPVVETAPGSIAEPIPAEVVELAPEEAASGMASADAPPAMAAEGPVGAPPTANSPPKKSSRGKKKKLTESPFKDYDNFSESLRRIPDHRILAINRGERAGLLKAKVKVDYDQLANRAIALLVPDAHPFRELLVRCVHDALTRLILPSLEREVRRELTETAEQHAVKVFAQNLKGLLLKPPVRGKRILSIDPGYRSGCSVAVLDPQGNVLHTDRLFVVGNAKRRGEHQQRLADLVRQFEVDVIAIGNGAGSRETEQMVSDAIRGPQLSDRAVTYAIVNEAGASVYSTSEIGCEELPGLAPHARSAVSIGRRLLDPLSELVKISPSHLGVGLYQHDIKAKHLADSLDEVVEVCVNHVGVDTNTASPALLQYVAGLNQSTARRLVEFRQATPIGNRQQLREVPGIGDSTFIQSAGFLRVYGGTEPFDQTAIHPESYAICERVLERAGWTKEQWVQHRHALREAAEPQRGAEAGQPPAAAAPETAPASSDDPLAKINAVQLAAELQVGELLMRDLLESLRRPSHDPRQDIAGPVFRSGIIKLEDLQPGMKLESQVLNVVDFGVFVDVGLGYSSLVHVSELSRKFIRNLYEHFSVGDALTTWVKEIDMARRRVKLTALEPGTQRERRERHRGRSRREPAGVTATTGATRPGARESRPPREPRPGGRPAGQNQRPAGQNQRPAGQNQRGGRSHPPSGSRRGRPQRTHYTRPAKPKPVAPITNEMIAGKKPMRSFSDLAQFFQIKTDPPSPNDGRESGEST